MKSYNPRLLNFDQILGVNRCESVGGVRRLASRASIFSMSRLSAFALSAALVMGTPLLHAQRGGGMSGGTPGGMGVAVGAHVGGVGAPRGGPSGTPNHTNGHPQRGIVGGFGHHRGGFRDNNRAFGNNDFLGSPYGGYWGDDGEEIVYEQPPAVQAEGAPEVQQRIAEPSRPPAEPLMIEWQGDRYVRSGGQISGALNGAHNNVVAQRDYSEAPRSAKSTSQSLPPAVLAFRNGTRQEVNSYMIVGKTLYASGDYWTQGYWSKTIQLADLDLPETIRLNQQRGVAFKLPTAPNDIVTRP